MTGARHPRKGEFAVYRGVSYDARERFGTWPEIMLLVGPGDPVPVGLEHRIAEDGSSVHLVDPEKLDAWYESWWTFRWCGEAFESTGAEDGRISGVYRGDDERFAAEHLTRRITDHEGVFPLDEVTDLTRHRVDLVAKRRDDWRRMVEAHMFRPGAFAVHRGLVHRAGTDPDALSRITLHRESETDPVPEGLEPDPCDVSGNTFLVPLDQIEEWYATRWTFRWRGGPFEATGVESGRIKGTYTGGSWGFADNFYLTAEPTPDGHLSYTLCVALEWVTDLTEHRTDLLATWKEQHQR